MQNQVVALFGLQWGTKSNSLSANKINLDISADTKRKILKSIASNFHPYNFNGPLMNICKLSLHKLQLQSDLDWDKSLTVNGRRE